MFKLFFNRQYKIKERVDSIENRISIDENIYITNTELIHLKQIMAQELSHKYEDIYDYMNCVGEDTIINFDFLRYDLRRYLINILLQKTNKFKKLYHLGIYTYKFQRFVSYNNQKTGLRQKIKDFKSITLSALVKEIENYIESLN